MVTLVGKRIILRPMQKKDISALVHLANDFSIARFTRIPYPYTRQLAQRFYLRHKKAFQSKKPETFFFLIINKATKEVMGGIELKRIEYDQQKAAIGYWMGKPYRGYGYVPEAVLLIFDFAFLTIHLNRIRIQCSAENPASQRVIRKVGCTYEGRLRENAILKTKKKTHKPHFTDSLVFSMLASEYRKKRRELFKKFFAD